MHWLRAIRVWVYHRTLFGKPQCHLIGLSLCRTFSSWLGAPLTCSKAHKARKKQDMHFDYCLFIALTLIQTANYRREHRWFNLYDSREQESANWLLKNWAYRKACCVVGPPLSHTGKAGQMETFIHYKLYRNHQMTKYSTGMCSS